MHYSISLFFLYLLRGEGVHCCRGCDKRHFSSNLYSYKVEEIIRESRGTCSADRCGTFHFDGLAISHILDSS